jgi:hypothetical protein
MKASCGIFLALACGASAFVPASFGTVRASPLRAFSDEKVAGDKNPPEQFNHEDKSEGRINTRIDMENPKVVHNISLAAGAYNYACRMVVLHCSILYCSMFLAANCKLGTHEQCHQIVFADSVLNP